MAKRRVPSVFQPLFISGFDRVLVLIFARLAWRWRRWPKSMVGVISSAALAASWPLVLELILLLLMPGVALHTRRAITWLVAISALDTLEMLCAWRAWDLWIKAIPSMDDLISGCTGIDRILQWYTKMLSTPRQLAVSIAFAASGDVFLWAISPVIRPHLEIGLVSYLSVAWTCAVGANGIYWLIINPELTRRILSLDNLHMIWHSPANTPAIIKLSRGYGFITIVVLGASLSTEFLAFQLSSYRKDSLLSALTIFVPVLAGVLALIVGLAPHLWLYVVVRNVRNKALLAVERLIGERPPGTRRTAEQIRGHIELYRLIEQSPGLPFSTVAMVQYAAAVLGSLVAYFLGRLSLTVNYAARQRRLSK
jgi:hypothetical protein